MKVCEMARRADKPDYARFDGKAGVVLLDESVARRAGRVWVVVGDGTSYDDRGIESLLLGGPQAPARVIR